MRTLVVSCGNPLRRDDGVAHLALRLIAPAPEREFREVHQLVPELAAEIAAFDRVIFVDADVVSTRLTFEPVRSFGTRSPLSHAATPEEVVRLARGLFAFAGEALVCHVPVQSLAPGEEMSAEAVRAAHEAADALAHLV